MTYFPEETRKYFKQPSTVFQQVFTKNIMLHSRWSTFRDHQMGACKKGFLPGERDQDTSSTLPFATSQARRFCKTQHEQGTLELKQSQAGVWSRATEDGTLWYLIVQAHILQVWPHCCPWVVLCYTAVGAGLWVPSTAQHGQALTWNFFSPLFCGG